MLFLGKLFHFRGLKKSLLVMTTLVLVFTNVKNHAQESNAANPFIEAIAKILGGITSVNIESATLGIDKGIIAGAVLGIGRTVERNPFPTGAHDQFLVKDRLRLGYELGAGFVVAGTVSYVQEWTLVYPVPTSLKGTLSRKFIVDLFLPIRASKWEKDQLPREYSLIRESFFEGKGRLRAGGVTPFMIGNQISLGRVKLTSTMARRYKNGDINLVREHSVFTRLAYEMWMNFILFDLPIFDSYKEVGRLKRTYRKVKVGDLTENPRKELLKALFTGMDERPLTNYIEDKEVDREVETKFVESYYGLNMFWIFTKDTYQREDYVTDTIYRKDPVTGLMTPETEELWQYSDRHIHDWTTGFSSETYRSNIFLNGEPVKDQYGVVTDLKEPQLRLNLVVQDFETSEKEFKEVYIPLTETFRKGDQGPLRVQDFDFSDQPESVLNMEVHYNERDLRKILNTTEEQWYDQLEEITGKKKVYWQRANETGFHSRDRRRLRQTRLPYHEIMLAKKLGTIVRFLKRARKLNSGKPLASFRTVAWAIRRMFGVGQSAWDIRLIKVLQSIVGRPQFSGVKYTQFRKRKNDVEHRTEFVSHSGTKDWIDRYEHQFVLKDPSEIYHFFDQESLSEFL